MREVLQRADGLVGGRRDRRRRHRGRDLPVRAAPGGRIDAGRSGRHGRRLGLRRLRRGRGLRAGPEVVVERRAPVLQRYGVSDDDAFAVGLTCGGILDVFVEKVVAGDLPRARRDRRRHRGRPAGRAWPPWSSTPTRAGVGRRLVVRPGDGAATRLARARTRADDASATTPSGCSPHGTTRRWPTGRTVSAAARGCGCSCGRSRRSRGCWSSARSTSRRPWPGSAASSATT